MVPSGRPSSDTSAQGTTRSLRVPFADSTAGVGALAGATGGSDARSGAGVGVGVDRARSVTGGVKTLGGFTSTVGEGVGARVVVVAGLEGVATTVGVVGAMEGAGVGGATPGAGREDHDSIETTAIPTTATAAPPATR